jgi:8-oxo-dGTP diphosphatase
MDKSHPTDPQEYQQWVKQLEKQWLAGVIPDSQTVAVIVLNGQGEVLLQLRDNNPNISFANFWTLPGGVVESNEKPEQAAQRELAEETGLRLDLFEWKVYKRASKNHKLMIEQHIFVGDTKQEVHEMILGEGQALHFFRWKDLPALSLAYGFDSLLEEFFTQRGAG